MAVISLVALVLCLIRQVLVLAGAARYARRVATGQEGPEHRYLIAIRVRRIDCAHRAALRELNPW